MRWFRRGVIIRLAIYVPLIAFLAWRSSGGCDTSPRAEPDGLTRELAPYRKVITLPDGTQQEIVELTAQEAEALLGPLPEDFREGAAKPPQATVPDAKSPDAKSPDAKEPEIDPAPDAAPSD